jgi:sugar phosphate isomerase/epimerase
MTLRDLSRPHDKVALNTATVKEATLRRAVECLAAAGVRGIAPWRDRVAECGVKEAARLISDHGLTVTGLCRGGLFTAEGKGGLAAALDENRRALDEAVAIGAASLVLVVGGLAAGSRDLASARALAAEAVAALLPEARAAGVTLALEPLHPMYAADRACLNTMAQANDLCDALGEGTGIAVDVYHVWWDPDLESEIARAGRTPGRLVGFHLCDWLVPTTDLLLDRGMMGDGVIDIRSIRGWMEAAGYDGLLDIEIFSAANWWRRPPEEVLRIALERVATLC